MTEVPAEFTEVAALAVASALQDDDQAVRQLLHSLPPEHRAAACEGALLTMAEMLRYCLSPESVTNAINGARQAARIAQEGTQT